MVQCRTSTFDIQFKSLECIRYEPFGMTWWGPTLSWCRRFESRLHQVVSGWSGSTYFPVGNSWNWNLCVCDLSLAATRRACRSTTLLYMRATWCSISLQVRSNAWTHHLWDVTWKGSVSYANLILHICCSAGNQNHLQECCPLPDFWRYRKQESTVVLKKLTKRTEAVEVTAHGFVWLIQGFDLKSSYRNSDEGSTSIVAGCAARARSKKPDPSAMSWGPLKELVEWIWRKIHNILVIPLYVKNYRRVSIWC